MPQGNEPESSWARPLRSGTMDVSGMPMDLDSDSVGGSVDDTLVVIDSESERALDSVPVLTDSEREGAGLHPLPQWPVSVFDEDLPRLIDDGDDETLPDSIDQSYPLSGLPDLFNMHGAPGPEARPEVHVIDDDDDDDITDDEAFDCAEIFSPPRVCRHAKTLGLTAAFSHDLTTGVDMLTVEGRGQVYQDIIKYKPKLLISSPPCTWWSRMRSLNLRHLSPQEFDDKDRAAKTLLDFSMACCRKQWSDRRLFVHEQPVHASSWAEPSVASMMGEAGVMTVDFDQCKVGLRSPDGRPMKKRTRLLTNSSKIIRTFSELQCDCETPHVQVLGTNLGIRLASYCQVYTPQLCMHLLQALRDP